MKQYLITWWGSFDPMMAVEDEEFFCDENGFDDEDAAKVLSLKEGESCRPDMDIMVTRIPDWITLTINKKK